MQTLGLAESTPRTENRWRALFWPTIKNEWDCDYVTTQGFWLCFIIAAFTVVLGAFTGSLAFSVFEGLFYFLAALGVRQRSRVAAIMAFAAYVIGSFVLQRYTGNGFGVVRIIFFALLFSNIRGNWLSARWAKQTAMVEPVRLNRTFGDKLADQLPVFLWPKMRFVFYIVAVIEIALLLMALFMPLV